MNSTTLEQTQPNKWWTAEVLTKSMCLTGHHLTVLCHIGLPGVWAADQTSSVCILPQGPSVGGSDFGVALCSLGVCARQAGKGQIFLSVFFFFFAFKGENVERSESTRNSSQRFMRKCLTPLVICVCGQVFHLIVYFVYVRSMQKYTVLCIVPLVGITVYCCTAIVTSHHRLTFTW